jgi:predicted lactoylglutathione lyase
MSDLTPDLRAVCIEKVIPILHVKNLTASIRYYVDALGFTVDWNWGDGENTASVSRDRQAIMLCQENQGQRGASVWIGVDDIGPLFAEFSARGATIRERPTNYAWAYEMKIEDPDGHVLRFGSERRNDLPPISAEWPATRLSNQSLQRIGRDATSAGRHRSQPPPRYLK